MSPKLLVRQLAAPSDRPGSCLLGQNASDESRLLLVWSNSAFQIVWLPIAVLIGSVASVVTALLKDWPQAKLDDALATNSLMEPDAVSDAVLFMLTRPRNIVIRDIVVLPQGLDL